MGPRTFWTMCRRKHLIFCLESNPSFPAHILASTTIVLSQLPPVYIPGRKARVLFIGSECPDSPVAIHEHKREACKMYKRTLSET
jgi:hypothetical protein